MANNDKQWSSATPGHIIFLVDQSGSMGEAYTEGKTRAEFTALVISRTIQEIINANMDGKGVKNRVFISVIGYGGSSSLAVDALASNYLGKINPLRTEKIKLKQSDGGGGLVEVDQKMPIFIEPVANGLTPMADALKFAKELIEEWLTRNPDNPAPIIINVSDGFPYTGNTVEEEMGKAISVSEEIMNLSCSDGSPLIFNAHIGDGGTKCQFSESETELSDEQAKFLFKISSNVPESYKEAAKKHGFPVGANSRGFVSNSDPENLIKFINFGSSGGTDKTSAN